MNIELLEKHADEDVQLLFFLSCLPGGAKAEQLSQMLGRDIKKGLAILDDLAFLESDDLSKRKLTPYMCNYCNVTLANQEREGSKAKASYVKTICKFYRDVLKSSFLLIGRVFP